jgi:hypothetical protein
MGYSEWYRKSLEEARKRGIDPSLSKHLRKSLEKDLRRLEKCKIFRKFVKGYIPIVPSCSFYNWTSRYRKKKEEKIKKILEEYLKMAGFVIHEEFLMPHNEWISRVDIYATREDKSFIFEVKPAFEPRGIGQAIWYSFNFKKHMPESETFLAFPCFEFIKTLNPEINEFIKKTMKDFKIKFIAIRPQDGLGIIEKDDFKWYDVCKSCVNCNGFIMNDPITLKSYVIPKESIEEINEKLKEYFQGVIS